MRIRGTEGSLRESPSCLMSPRSRRERRNLAINGVSVSSGKPRLNLAASESCVVEAAPSLLHFRERDHLSLLDGPIVELNTHGACLSGHFLLRGDCGLGTRPDKYQFPVSTNVPEPTPAPQASPLLTPETVLSLPTPAPMLSPTPSPTPLPDGTMPLPLPAMPTPVLQDAKRSPSSSTGPFPRPASSRSHSLNPANGNSRQQSSFLRLIRRRPFLLPPPPRNLINRGDIERVKLTNHSRIRLLSKVYSCSRGELS